MIIPPLRGVIDRRMLVNFAADPEVVQQHLPAPFRPQLYNGKAVVGICLIRLKDIRFNGFPSFLGLNSENGAHRFAVEWEENGILKTGVYIPRRDTSSAINAYAGNRIFPGRHFKAKFNVKENLTDFNIELESSDNTRVVVNARLSDGWSKTSLFETLGIASNFFKGGSVGYSPRGAGFDGIELHTKSWNVKPLEVSHVYSSFFEDSDLFPKGSVVFDNALLMQNIPHEWSGVSRLAYCP
jgi:hypothetical protein